MAAHSKDSRHNEHQTLLLHASAASVTFAGDRLRYDCRSAGFQQSNGCSRSAMLHPLMVWLALEQTVQLSEGLSPGNRALKLSLLADAGSA